MANIMSFSESKLSPRADINFVSILATLPGAPLPSYLNLTVVLFDIANIEDDVGTSGEVWPSYRIEAENADTEARIERWHEGRTVFCSL